MPGGGEYAQPIATPRTADKHQISYWMQCNAVNSAYIQHRQPSRWAFFIQKVLKPYLGKESRAALPGQTYTAITYSDRVKFTLTLNIVQKL